MSGDSLKILIADDNQVNLQLLESVVRRLGHVAVVAGNGREAIEVFRREAPDLVLMDVMMPHMDGMTAVREIRALPADTWVPIIFCSAMDRVEDIVRGLECGGDDYLVKPIFPQLLRAKLNHYAQLLKLQRDVRAYTGELENWREEAQEQARLGAHVMARLTDAEGLRDPLLQHFNFPADTFSGDLLCAARGPGG